MQPLAHNQSSRHLKRDQSHMSPTFSKVFNSEVESASGFFAGGQSYLVQSIASEEDCNIAVGCLVRGNYPVYRTTPHEILYRLDSKYVNTYDALDVQFEEAECYFIFDLMDEGLAANFTPAEKSRLVWFVKEAINAGAVIILPVPNEHTDLNLYGESFGNYLEQEFEVIHGKTPKKR